MLILLDGLYDIIVVKYHKIHLELMNPVVYCLIIRYYGI